MAVGIGLPCGLDLIGPGLDPSSPQKGWNVAIWLSKSFIALPSDAPQSFRIVGPLLFAASSSGRLPRAGKVDRGAGVSKDSAAGRRVFAPPPPWPAFLPALFRR